MDQTGSSRAEYLTESDVAPSELRGALEMLDVEIAKTSETLFMLREDLELILRPEYDGESGEKAGVPMPVRAPLSDRIFNQAARVRELCESLQRIRERNSAVN